MSNGLKQAFNFLCHQTLMNARINQVSIGRKLAVTIAVAVTLSGVLTTGVSLWQEYLRYAASHRESLLAAASAFSSAVAGPVLKGDQAGTFEALRGIGGVPQLQHAVVKDRTGRVIAEVGASARLDSDAILQGSGGDLFDLLTSHSIEVVVPVLDGTDTIGELEVLSDASDLLGGLARSLAASLAGTAVALILGLASAVPLHRAMIRPLVDLTNAMTRVRDDHDFSARLPDTNSKGGSDEIGILVTGFNSMLSEISTRDNRLARHLERLEEDVLERTRDLVAAKAEADNANAAKSDFLATMSHEIRTPMTGMLVMAELLASDALPARSRRYADVISSSGKTLLAIINDILDFAKIEAGKMALEEVPVEVEAVVGTVLNLFYARAREKGVDLAVRIAPDVPAVVRADPVRLNQVVSNLVNNALKFTEAGEVMIDVSRLPGSALVLRIAVSDTGIGIETAKLGSIFEAFGQADQSTSRRFGGTGLGLAISNRLIGAMGSTIQVESKPGEGSVFFFDLPTFEIEPAATLVCLGEGRTVFRSLVAVEGAACRRALISVLESAGSQVETGEAVDVAKEGSYQLVVADAPSLITAGPRVAGYVVALLQPNARLDRSLNALADAVLTRPLLPADLHALIRHVARGERYGGGTAAIAALPDTPIAHPNARILAADDTAVNREVLAEALRRFGILHPKLVTNGVEAVEAMRAGDYDLVLMDGSMPVLDGFKACLQIRQIEAETGRRRTPIIALTAHVVGKAAEAWKDAGMDGILYKPYTMADLDHCLATWLAENPAGPVDMALQPAFESEDNEAYTKPLFDRAVLDDITRISERSSIGFTKRVFGLYRNHAPKACAQIEEAMACADDESIASSAHALKSMSSNIGAVRVANIAGHLERLARDSRAETGVVEALAQAVVLTLQAMEDLEDTCASAGGSAGAMRSAAH